MTEEVIVKVNEFFSTEWQAYEKLVKDAALSPFKTYEPIEISPGE
jgi:hypothetical protein